MITKSQLAELREHWEKECNPDCGFEDEQDCPIDMDDVFGTISALLDENEKLRRVKEAAKNMRGHYCSKDHDGQLRCSCDELESALAALEGKE